MTNTNTLSAAIRYTNIPKDSNHFKINDLIRSQASTGRLFFDGYSARIVGMTDKTITFARTFPEFGNYEQYFAYPTTRTRRIYRNDPDFWNRIEFAV